eukprot:scaffold1804_cov263-Pinguiococcus_pyrenoidosus.AAC.7
MGMAYFRPLGPIEAMPPRIRHLLIEGGCEVGSVLTASYEYRGGFEGPTQVWWLRVHPDGSRVKISQPTCIPMGSRRSGSSENPLHYVIKPEDLGCMLKAKCRAIRNDGVEGTVTTSQPFEVVAATPETEQESP